MAASAPSAGDGTAPSGGGMLARMVGLVLATVLAAAAGLGLAWLVESGRIGAGKRAAAAEAERKTPAASGALTQVPSILVTLEGASRPWLRLDLQLVTEREGMVSDTAAAEYGHDVLALLRTLSADRLQGPSGLHALVEDLEHIARHRIGAGVRRVLLRSMVLE